MNSFSGLSRIVQDRDLEDPGEIPHDGSAAVRADSRQQTCAGLTASHRPANPVRTDPYDRQSRYMRLVPGTRTVSVLPKPLRVESHSAGHERFRSPESLGCPSRAKQIFSGFKSRWTTPLAWARSSDRASSVIMEHTSPAVSCLTLTEHVPQSFSINVFENDEALACMNSEVVNHRDATIVQ